MKTQGHRERDLTRFTQQTPRWPVLVPVQAAGIATFTVICAAIVHMCDIGSVWLGSFVGCLVGLVVTECLAKHVMTLERRYKPEYLSPKEYRRLYKRYRIAGYGCVAFVGSVVVYVFVSLVCFKGHMPSTYAIMIGVCGVVFCRGLLTIFGIPLLKWNCPQCGASFFRRSCFTRSPHCCHRCGFSISED